MGFLSGLFGDGGTDEAADYLKSVPVPKLRDLEVQLQELVSQGQLSPEQAQTILQGPSAYETIQADPRLRNAQTDALAQMQEIARAGGLDAIGKAGLEDALQQQRTESRGAQEAILANARARGIGGSDLELVNRLLAQQGAATRGSRAALDTAAEAQRRRDAALTGAAGLAGGIRQQDYGEASSRASAQDAISRFNAANQQQVQNQNVNARNVAQAGNLAERQRIADANTGQRNDQRVAYGQTLPLQLYGLRTGQAGNLGDLAMAKAQKDADRDKALLSTGASVIGAFAASDERVKENVEPLDSRSVLSDLAGSTWNYKGTGQPGVGVMAQDVEKSPLAGMVEESADGTKMLDYGELGFEDGQEGGLVLGIMSDLNRRLMAVEGKRRA